MHALAKIIFLWFIEPFYKQGNESCAEAVCFLHSKCDFSLNLTAFNWAFRMCSTW